MATVLYIRYLLVHGLMPSIKWEESPGSIKFICNTHVLYVILLCCHDVASELSVLFQIGKISTETHKKLEPVYSNKTVGPSTDCNPGKAAKDGEMVARECRMTLKSIQNPVQILFEDVTYCKIWAKFFTQSHGSAIQAQREVFFHNRQTTQVNPLL